MHRVHLQVSLRTDANTRLLLKHSFKYSINTYWVTSLEAPDALWSEELPPSHEAVQRLREQVVSTAVWTVGGFGNTWRARRCRLGPSVGTARLRKG